MGLVAWKWRTVLNTTQVMRIPINNNNHHPIAGGHQEGSGGRWSVLSCWRGSLCISRALLNQGCFGWSQPGYNELRGGNRFLREAHTDQWTDFDSWREFFCFRWKTGHEFFRRLLSSSLFLVILSLVDLPHARMSDDLILRVWRWFHSISQFRR